MAGGGGERVPFYKVLGLIWRPGVVLGLATAPFASIAAFLALDYQAQGWGGEGFPVAARILEAMAGAVLRAAAASDQPDYQNADPRAEGNRR